MKQNHLKKQLGFFELFAIAAGSMISSGIFILPGMAFAQTGPSVFLSYFFAGIIALTGALSIAEMATAMPKAGADYFFITRSLGTGVGTVSGLLSWFALSLKSAFAIIGIAEIIRIFLGWDPFLVSSALAVFFAFLNIFGVKEAGRFQIILVTFLLIILIGYIFGGFYNVKISAFEPFTKNGLIGIFYGSGFVFVAYGGLLKTASMSEEVINPKKNIPAAFFSSLFVVTILYSLAMIVTVGVVPGADLAKSLTPLADGAKLIAGTPGFIILTAAAALAFITTANAGIMAASRYPVALAEDKLLPAILTKVHKKLGSPWVSVLLTFTVIMLFLLLKLEILVKAASTVIILSYILANISIIILRESKIQNYRPSFKAPFYPWIQIGGIMFLIFLIVDMGLQTLLLSTLLIICGLMVYLFYGKIRSGREYALLHLVEKVFNKKLTHYDLETEFKQIINERDEILKDDFDHLVDRALIKDIDSAMSAEELFENVSAEIANDCDLSETNIKELLLEREQESSTVISSFAALPHIVVEKPELFCLMIIRCKKGIRFPDTPVSAVDENTGIQAVFILIGSKDKRQMHLKSISAIAQILTNEKFEKRWLTARNPNELKDLIHLSNRKRF